MRWLLRVVEVVRVVMMIKVVMVIKVVRMAEVVRVVGSKRFQQQINKFKVGLIPCP